MQLGQAPEERERDVSDKGPRWRQCRRSQPASFGIHKLTAVARLEYITRQSGARRGSGVRVQWKGTGSANLQIGWRTLLRVSLRLLVDRYWPTAWWASSSICFERLATDFNLVSTLTPGFIYTSGVLGSILCVFYFLPCGRDEMRCWGNCRRKRRFKLYSERWT